MTSAAQQRRQLVLLRRHLVILAVLIGTPAVWAAIRHVRESESQDLLVATASAHRRVNYAGAVVWSGRFGDDSLEHGRKSFDHDGKSSGHGRKSFGYGGNSRPRQTTFGVRHDADSGHTTYSMDGPWKQWTLSQPSSRMPDPAAWCLVPDRVAENYRAEEIGKRRFLDREVRVVRVRPIHRGRPSMEIWADAETLLPLKVTTYRPDGSEYRVAKFRRVEFGPQPQARSGVPGTERWFGKRIPLDGLERSADFRPLLPEYLPDGFRLVEARVQQWATPRLTLLYSDGATAFELSQSPLATPAVLEAFHRQHMGEDRARGMMDWHMTMARKRLVETDAGTEVAGKVTCRYKRGGIHSTHELRVDGIDVKLSARSDLDRELVLQVLRSLRQP